MSARYRAMIFSGRINVDTGLEWAQMWMLNAAYPTVYTAGLWQPVATVERVLLARRKLSGHRSRAGERFRLYVRLPGHHYGELEYYTTGEGFEASADYPYQRFFLTEEAAWAAYVVRLTKCLDQLRETIQQGEGMLAEAEGILKLRRGR